MWTVTLAEILKFMAIASQLSGLPLAKDTPFVFVQPDAEIQREFCGSVGHCVQVYGFTDVRHSEIHISDELGLYTRDVMLVHELTHWLAFRADVNQHNYCKDEEAAYKTEVKYLRYYEHRDDPEPSTFLCK